MSVIAWVSLAAAIAAEVAGTSLLKVSDGFSRLWPSLGCGASYVVAFALLGFAVRDLPIGLAYAVWAGLGTVAVAVIGIVAFGEGVSLMKIIGIALVVVGVGVLNLGGGH